MSIPSLEIVNLIDSYNLKMYPFSRHSQRYRRYLQTFHAEYFQPLLGTSSTSAQSTSSLIACDSPTAKALQDRRHRAAFFTASLCSAEFGRSFCPTARMKGTPLRAFFSASLRSAEFGRTAVAALARASPASITDGEDAVGTSRASARRTSSPADRLLVLPGLLEPAS